MHKEQKLKEIQIIINEFSVDDLHDFDNFLIDKSDNPPDVYIHKYENLTKQQRSKTLLNKTHGRI